VHEPALHEETFFRSRVVNDLTTFKSESDVIIANRFSDDLKDVEAKIFTRDLFGHDS
jgi:UDPglucose 6-dehydrogenase